MSAFIQAHPRSTSSRFYIPWVLMFTAATSMAQQDAATTDADLLKGVLNQGQRMEAVRAGTAREVKVIASTLARQEIDRTVLNRLMQEISSSPEQTRRRLDVDENQLQNIFITLSNARSFINDSEMANIRAMCRAWDLSVQTGDNRIREALGAYSKRQRLTLDFIEKYYRVVLGDIDSLLSAESKILLADYMNDRRRRMANAGATTTGAIVQNLASGTETVRFHCRDQRASRD